MEHGCVVVQALTQPQLDKFAQWTPNSDSAELALRLFNAQFFLETMAHLVAYSAGQLTAATTGSEQGEGKQVEGRSAQSFKLRSSRADMAWFCAALPRRHVALWLLLLSPRVSCSVCLQLLCILLHCDAFQHSSAQICLLCLFAESGAEWRHTLCQWSRPSYHSSIRTKSRRQAIPTRPCICNRDISRYFQLPFTSLYHPSCMCQSRFPHQGCIWRTDA
jgi:hypothetical protein